MDGDQVIERIRHLKEAGVIRKFRARIDQRKVGISANALVAWKASGLAAVTREHCWQHFPQ